MKKSFYFILISVFFFAGCNVTDKKSSECDKEKQSEEANKEMVVSFYQELFGDKNIAAIDKYIGDIYIQHNPSLPDGKQALKDAVKQWFSEDALKEKVDFQKVAADGDIVFLHIKNQWGLKSVSIIDIFRIENGKIIEHWDVIQEVPENSINDHPMF